MMIAMEKSKPPKRAQELLNKRVRPLFPEEVGSKKSSTLLRYAQETLSRSAKDRSAPWLSLKSSSSVSKTSDLFDKIPEDGLPPNAVISAAVENFFDKVPNWCSSELMYNICAPVNAASQALLSLAQEMNIHNINDDFAGKCLLVEKQVSGMMADLVDLDREKVKALFSFGGTASNLYAMKLGINKTVPNAGKHGIGQNVHVMITSDAHFSHKTAGDWLGIGVDRLITINSDNESRSLLEDAESKARKIIEKGGIIAAITINGGPFYDFAIDDVEKFVELRSKLIKDYKLEYVPHLHVDTVIGWGWLMFNGYDFWKNPLGIQSDVLPIIQKQFERVYKIRLADSWGVDFHKALGGCPTPCGLFVSNNSKELLLLSKSHRGIDTDHLDGEWSINHPSDITLETSRSAGPALAAMGSLLTMGKNGFRSFLSNQITVTKGLREEVSKSGQFIVGNPESLGFNTMVLPLLGSATDWKSFLAIVENDESVLTRLNGQLKSFYEWSLNGDGDRRLGCSFSNSFRRTSSGKPISGLKYCIVSPHITKETVKSEVKKLNEQFKKFLDEHN